MALPDAFNFSAESQEQDLTLVVRRVLDCAAGAGLGELLGLGAGGGATKRAGADEIVAALRSRKAGQIMPVVFQGGHRIEVKPSSAMTSITGYWLRDDQDESACRQALASTLLLFESLAQVGRLTGGSVYRVGGGSKCLPEPPLVGTRRCALLVDQEAVAREYDDPNAFWASGWDQVVGESQRLCVRASSAVSSGEYLRAVLEHQWALVRAARAGLTKYYRPRFEDDERAIYEQGPPRLETTGYDPGEAKLVLSAALSESEHVRGFEIDGIREVLQSGSMKDGRAVRAVHVVFLGRAAAEQERRPLLDVGAKVFFLGAEEQLTELTS